MKARLLVLLGLPAALALGAAAYHLSEARRLGAHLRALEANGARLERELTGVLLQRDELNRFLEEKTAELVAEREQRRERLREALRPMPEGVRLALSALNELLAEDGFGGLRALAARAIEGRALLGIELLEQDAATLRTQLHLAEELTLHLDREAGSLTLRLRGGHRWADGERVPYSDEGWPLVLTDVEGPKWEARLGYLLEVTGTYPPPPELVERRNVLDAQTRASWIERFNRLLGDAGTELSYRVQQIDAVADGAFLGVMLLGFEPGKTLSLACEAARLSVLVDPRAQTVELLLEDGVLRKAGGEARIGPRGYRILLPQVTREKALEAMMGMVVSR